MKFFSQTDKGILIILTILVIIALLVGFITYRYIYNSAVTIENYVGGAQI